MPRFRAWIVVFALHFIHGKERVSNSLGLLLDFVLNYCKSLIDGSSIAHSKMEWRRWNGIIASELENLKRNKIRVIQMISVRSARTVNVIDI